MKCFNHLEADASGTCQDCGKGLCNDCVNRFDFPNCVPCLLAHNDRVSRQLLFGLLGTLGLFVVGSYLIYTQVNMYNYPWKSIGAGALLAGTYWGWRFLSDYLPSLTMGGMLTWGIYLACKGIASYFIGIVVGPYQIFKMLRQRNAINHIKKQIAENEI